MTEGVQVITSSDIYWLTRFDAINVAAGIGLAISAACTIISLFVGGTYVSGNSDESDAEVRRFARVVSRRAATVGGIFCALVIFLPSTKEAVAIKVIPVIANNGDVQGLGQDMVKLAREWMIELMPKSAEVRK